MSRYLTISHHKKGIIRLIESKSGDEIAIVKHDKHAWQEFSPDGRYLATASEDGTARLLLTKTGETLSDLSFASPLQQILFSQNSRILLALSRDGEGTLVHTASGQIIFSLKISATSFEGLADFDAVFSPNSNFLALANHKGEVRLFATDDGRELATLPPAGLEVNLGRLVFSPQERFLGVTKRDGIVDLIRTSDGDEVVRIRHNQFVDNIEFSTDGRFLLTRTIKGIVRLISTDTGLEIAMYQPEDGVNSAAFSPDGTLLALATQHSVYLYPSDPERLFELMCAKAGRNLSMVEWNDYIGTSEPKRPTCANWDNPDEPTESKPLSN